MYSLYSSDACSGCAQVKAFFKEQEIPYKEFNISKNIAKKEFLLAEGHRSVPVLYNEDKYIATGALPILKKINERN